MSSDQHLGRWAFRSSCVVLILGSERINKRIPGALLAVIGDNRHWATFSSSQLGRHVARALSPAACRHLACRRMCSPRRYFQALLPTAGLLVFVVILAQSAATSRAYASKYGDLRRERRSHRPGVGQPRCRPIWHVRGQWQPDQDADGRRCGRQESAGAAGRRRDRRVRTASALRRCWRICPARSWPPSCS